MNILIIGGGLQALSCASSLHKSHKIFVIGHGVQITMSKFFEKVFDSTDLNKEQLINIIKLYHIHVIIPVSDISVKQTSILKHEIEEETECKVAVPEYELVEIVESKGRFMDFCEINKIPHPKTFHLPLVNNDIEFPALIKPDYSVGARGITKVNSLKELSDKLTIISNEYGPCSLQEIIPNNEYYYNVMLYRNAAGLFLAYTIIKIVRMYPINGGSSSCCISVENNELLSICKDCLNKMGWVGFADFDVLYNNHSGEYKIIEINPRVPASLKAAAISGVNFPEIIVRDTLELPGNEYVYSTGKILRYLGTDILWFIKSKNRFNTLPRWISFISKNTYYQDIYINDPSTWLSWILGGICKCFIRNKRLR